LLYPEFHLARIRIVAQATSRDRLEALGPKAKTAGLRGSLNLWDPKDLFAVTDPGLPPDSECSPRSRAVPRVSKTLSQQPKTLLSEKEFVHTTYF